MLPRSAYNSTPTGQNKISLQLVVVTPSILHIKKVKILYQIRMYTDNGPTCRSMQAFIFNNKINSSIHLEIGHLNLQLIRSIIQMLFSRLLRTHFQGPSQLQMVFAGAGDPSPTLENRFPAAHLKIHRFEFLNFDFVSRYF